jgi:hypothetical protein
MSLDALISIRVKYLLRASRLVASCERAVSRAIGYKDEGGGNWRPWNMRRSQEADGRCAVVKICPYLRFRMSDGLPKILYVGFESCVRWPLFVKVNPSEQMELAGRDSRWHRDPKSCQRLPPPTWWPNQPRGEGCLGHMSHDLRQFLVRRPPADSMSSMMRASMSIMVYYQYLRIWEPECRRKSASGLVKADLRPHSSKFSHLLIWTLAFLARSDDFSR